MTDEEKLYQVYYQPDRLWTGGKAIKELHEITSMWKEGIRSWLAKEAFCRVHIPPPKKIDHPHYDVTKPNEVAFVSGAIHKKGGSFKYSEVFHCDNGGEFKGEVTKLLEKQNIDIRRATTKYKHNHMANYCLNRWMPKSSRTLKRCHKFG